MKKIIALISILGVMFTCSCSCQNHHQKDDKIQDLETGMYIGPKDFVFDPVFIEDFVYDPVEELYYIEYSAKDPDYCYIQIQCAEDAFFDILTKVSDKDTLTKMYYIEEVFTPVEGGINISYLLKS